MDVSQYLEIFIDETEEHLQTLSDCIMELEKEPENSRLQTAVNLLPCTLQRSGLPLPQKQVR